MESTDIDSVGELLSEQMTKIIIADDHTVLREALLQLVEAAEATWTVVGEASDGFEVLSLVEKQCADLVILDLTMPNLGGIETLIRLQKTASPPPVLVLSAREDDIAVNEAISAGAKGYVTKRSGWKELEFAIRAVLRGTNYLSPEAARGVIAHNNEEKQSPIANLSGREREVLKLLSEGKPNREAAKMLHISPRTIDSHRANIMKKLGVGSNAEMVQAAVRYGLVA